MRKVLIFIVRLYQKTLSPDQGFTKKIGLIRVPTCAFYPTCSEYFILAIEKYGILHGLSLFSKRIFRCHPWQKEHLDPLT